MASFTSKTQTYLARSHLVTSSKIAMSKTPRSGLNWATPPQLDPNWSQLRSPKGRNSQAINSSGSMIVDLKATLMLMTMVWVSKKSANRPLFSRCLLMEKSRMMWSDLMTMTIRKTCYIESQSTICQANSRIKTKSNRLKCSVRTIDLIISAII